MKPQGRPVLERVVLPVASVLQGIAAAIVIIEYFKPWISSAVGKTAFYVTILVVSGLAAIVALWLLLARAEHLSSSRLRVAAATAVLGIGTALFTAGFWVGMGGTSTLVLEPTAVEDLPFLKFRSFSFEEDLEEWQLCSAIPVESSIEHSAVDAQDGEGFWRLRSSLPGETSGQSVQYTQTVCVCFGNQKWTVPAEAIVGYVKVPPSEQTIENTFWAEIQAVGESGGHFYAVKTRYRLSPGKWTPIVWTRPTWFSSLDANIELLFPDAVSLVTLLIWSEKPYVGSVFIDSVSFYAITRP